MKDKKITDIITLVFAGITAVAITVCALLFGSGSETLIIAPLYISIVIVFMQSKVNRFAFLFGAVNSLFYTAVYIYDGLYLTAVYAALFSFPVQLWTFIRWKNRDSKGKTVFRRMTDKARLITVIGFAACFVIFYSLLRYFGSDWGVYDCVSMLLGILITILCAVPYIEYSPLQCTSVAVGLVLYAKMAASQPIQYTYLAYQIYCMFCVSVAFIRITRIYRRQKNEASEGIL